MAVVVVILLLTYLVTSADSAVLIINTINSGGDEGPKGRPHIIFWGSALGLVVGALLIIGGVRGNLNCYGDWRPALLYGDGIDGDGADKGYL